MDRRRHHNLRAAAASRTGLRVAAQVSGRAALAASDAVEAVRSDATAGPRLLPIIGIDVARARSSTLRRIALVKQALSVGDLPRCFVVSLWNTHLLESPCCDARPTAA